MFCLFLRLSVKSCGDFRISYVCVAVLRWPHMLHICVVCCCVFSYVMLMFVLCVVVPCGVRDVCLCLLCFGFECVRFDSV